MFLCLSRAALKNILTQLYINSVFLKLQPSPLITECVNPTRTTKGVITSAFTALASQTTRPTCSAATTTTPPSNTAATKQSSRCSCRSTSRPLQTVMHTSKSKKGEKIITVQEIQNEEMVSRNMRRGSRAVTSEVY